MSGFLAEHPLIKAATAFATMAHEGQWRKYTREPYIVHPKAVADILYTYTDASPHVLAAGLLHDVLEDTEVQESQLRREFGETIADLVLEVTDVSKPSDGNRAARKALDREHLMQASPEGKRIKLADLIDNTKTIVEYDPKFAKVYLAEKDALLPVLREGNAFLWYWAKEQVGTSRASLK